MTDVKIPNVFRVHAAASGRWRVEHEGSPAMLYDDKEAAVTAAVELARVQPLAVVRVYSISGHLESERTYANEAREAH